MEYTAREYQKRMTQAVLDLEACALWADPGLGKSVSLLSAIVALQEDRFETTRWLIVAPKRVIQLTWPKEIAKWAHTQHLDWRIVDTDDIHLHRVQHPKDPARKMLTIKDRAGTKKRLQGMPETIHLVSNEQFPHLVKAYGVNFPYDGLAIDEARSLLSSKNLVFRAVRAVRPFLNRFVELTGTPAANGLEDIYSPVGLLDGGKRLGKSKKEFRERFMRVSHTIEVGNRTVPMWEMRDKESVIDAVKDICFAFRQEDWLELPELIITPEWVRIPNHAKVLHDELKRELVAEVNGNILTAAQAGTKLAKLLQIANGRVIVETEDGEKTAQVVHEAKLDALEEIVENTERGIIVGYRYTADREAILKRLGKKAGRIDRLQDWIAGKFPVLVMHPKEGGHGLDGLQGAGHNVVWYGCPHDLDHFKQLNSRLHRHGTQAGHVLVRVLCAADTIEDKLPERLAGKGNLQNGLLEALKG